MCCAFLWCRAEGVCLAKPCYRSPLSRSSADSSPAWHPLLRAPMLNDTIHVVESKPAKRYGDYFLRQIVKITTFSNSNTYRCKNVTNNNKTTWIAIKNSKTNTNATASSLARNWYVPSPSNWTFLPRTWDRETRMMTVTRLQHPRKTKSR
ncbi:uncharacterized protein LOC111242120 [Vigna radiata var. radiata]|uniref:Uncharacterized protein LOC111242120 n=1 Tax=Vigna radiata var. radiata TaxID=3916 RepID=A0A3Q0FC16_VIGRR|nr:uncharacterized protein LOC111242120 [Vigna radiata var. radiata]